jgi:hypothetical protein
MEMAVGRDVMRSTERDWFLRRDLYTCSSVQVPLLILIVDTCGVDAIPADDSNQELPAKGAGSQNLVSEQGDYLNSLITSKALANSSGLSLREGDNPGKTDEPGI